MLQNIVLVIILIFMLISFILFLYSINFGIKDPVVDCEVYKEKGCVHVDGFLCDYPNCNIVSEYNKNKIIKV